MKQVNGKQMSDEWIKGNNRLINAVGGNNELLRTIDEAGYKRILAEVTPNNTIIYKELDEMANVTEIFTP
jgi:hypothetical protein